MHFVVLLVYNFSKLWHKIRKDEGNWMDTIIVRGLASIFCKSGNYIILAGAMINVVVYLLVKKKIKVTEELFNPKIDKVNGLGLSLDWKKEEIAELKKCRKDLVVIYAWFANITAVFPLLGILGTVAALVTYSNDTMMDNFMAALGTTLLGVLSAIIFKCLDARVSGSLDVIVEDADSVVQDYNREKRKNNEA